MKTNDIVTSIDFLVGRRIDFFIGDDIFELEGIVYKSDGKYFVDDMKGVDHILRVAGSKLEVYMKYNDEIWMNNYDTGEVFDCEVNRAYDSLINPSKKEFEELVKKGFTHFFKKWDDITVAYNKENGRWYFSIATPKDPQGILSDYDSLDALLSEKSEYIQGDWQVIYYDCEWNDLFFVGGIYYGYGDNR